MKVIHSNLKGGTPIRTMLFSEVNNSTVNSGDEKPNFSKTETIFSAFLRFLEIQMSISPVGLG